MKMVGDFNIVENGQIGKQPDVLKGSGNTALRHFVRFQSDQALAVKQHLTGGRFIYACHQVERGRFACAVRADQSDQLTFVDFDVEVGDSFQSAELFGQFIYFQQRHAVHLPGFD